MNGVVRQESAGQMLGVRGRFFNVVADDDGRILNQEFRATRPYRWDGRKASITVEVRYDTLGGANRLPNLAICGDISHDGPAGQIVEDISKAFPELVPLLKWHLCGPDGPMHYLANAVYLAGDRCHHGKRAGEPWAWDDAVQFGSNPIKHKLTPKFAAFLIEAGKLRGEARFDFEVLRYDHDDRGRDGRYQFGPKFTFGGFAERWHSCPFDSEDAALDFLRALRTCDPQFLKIPAQWSEGKPRDLAGARRVAIWPDATDAELMQEPDDLRATLKARLPALQAEFRAAVEGAGLLWEAPRA